MLLKCTADGRIKANGAPVHQGNVARGMKMTMSTTSMMSARVHRKVMRAPHKRAHPGKMPHAAGKMAHTAGKTAHHAGKLAHLGKFGKLAHYAQTAHALRPPEPGDNSNDSGFGPDHEQRHAAANRLTDTTEDWQIPVRRRRPSEMEVKIECDNANDAFAFPAPCAAPAPSLDAAHAPLPPPPPLDSIRAGCSISSPGIPNPANRFHDAGYRPCGKLGSSGKLGNKFTSGGKLGNSGKLGGGKLGGKYGGKLAQALARRRALAMAQTGPPGLATPLSMRSRDGQVELQILCQPETQHRARYQTEGSRGAVKDNSGNGFPVVKLVGYDKPAVLQVFIGTDTGRVAPHMFYQACRVSGKNSTPCKERKEDGTVVIEIDLDPTKNWQVTCDCVGILKERNVDVEHRFGEALSGGAGAALVARGKKKSTRCRMVFRAEILCADGTTEVLQACSTQIICTQPPGVPEVCRKSLVSCPAAGGLELYLLGKNFLKETRVVFCRRQDGRTTWEEEVVPDKEFLQQTHLVCCVPPYICSDIAEPVSVQFFVRSGGKASEPHHFFYTPASLDTGPLHATRHHTQGSGEEPRPVAMWGGGGALMPPPALPTRRPSVLLPDAHSPLSLKSELDDSSQHSLLEHADTSCGPDGPDQNSQMMSEDLKVVDLRLKSENISGERQVSFVGYADGLSPPPAAPSPLASFTQQMQAIQNQVQTDKMVESVTAAIFNSDENAGQMSVYVDPMPMAVDPMQRLIAAKAPLVDLAQDMKLGSELMPASAVMQTSDRQRMLVYNAIDKMQAEAAGARREEPFNPFQAITRMEMEPTQLERRLARQSAHMEALVEDAMKATAAMLPSDAAKLDALVNSRADDHLSASTSPSTSDSMLSPAAALPAAALSPDAMLNPQVAPSMLCEPSAHIAPSQQELMLMADQVQMSSVKTPPAAVKSMILNAAAEILTSDKTMNALVTSAIETANILTTESAAAASGGGLAAAEPPGEQEPAGEQAPLSAMSQAVSQAVTQAVSQAVTQAVSQAVSQELTAPVQGLTDMSDSDLLSYINPSAFDQVL